MKSFIDSVLNLSNDVSSFCLNISTSSSMIYG